MAALQHALPWGACPSAAEVLVQAVRFTGERGLAGEGTRGEAKALRLSQSDLAHMASVSRQTINKEPGLLALQDIVKVTYGGPAIFDMPALRRIAEVR